MGTESLENFYPCDWLLCVRLRSLKFWLCRYTLTVQTLITTSEDEYAKSERIIICVLATQERLWFGLIGVGLSDFKLDAVLTLEILETHTVPGRTEFRPASQSPAIHTLAWSWRSFWLHWTWRFGWLDPRDAAHPFASSSHSVQQPANTYFLFG